MTVAAASALGFLAGYVAFHRIWNKAPQLSDGSRRSFARTAEQIAAGDLLTNASPQERVGWLLEICRQPSSLKRDHALYEAIQRMQPGDFLAALADLPAFGEEMVEMKNEVRYALIQAGMERWLEVDKDGALRWLSAARMIVESGTMSLPSMDSGDGAALYGVLARSHPEWLFEQTTKLGTKTQRATAIRSLLNESVQRDPRQARIWLESYRGTQDWKDAFSVYVTGLALSDPRTAMDMALGTDGQLLPNKKDLPVNVIVETAKHSPTVATELLLRLEPKRRRELTWFMVGWIKNYGTGDPFAYLQEQVAADPELLSAASDNIAP